MAQDTPALRFRPEYEWDGEGKRIKELGVGVTVWCDTITHANTLKAIFLAEEDVVLGDLIVMPHP